LPAKTVTTFKAVTTNVTSVLITFPAVYIVSATSNVHNVRVGIILGLITYATFVNLLFKVVFTVTLHLSAFNAVLDFTSTQLTTNAINAHNQDAMCVYKQTQDQLCFLQQ